MKRININADLGESFGAYSIGDDAALLDIVASANVACGFHGGDASVMRRTVRAALDRGVSIGAHPSFDDLRGFGRRRIHMPAGELEDMLIYQIGALQAVAHAEGGAVTHVKAHGALNNMACVDATYANAVAAAVAAAAPDALHLVMPGTELETASRAHDLRIAREAFVDRTYEADGTLTPRSVEGSVLRDPAAAAARMVAFLTDGALTARTGERVALACDSLCVHGDEPSAVAVAAAVRAAIEAAGIAIAPLPEIVS